jgi:hypothetical protein
MLNSSPLYFSASRRSDPQDEEIGEVCIANISPAERKKRVWFSVRQLVTTLFVLGILVWLDVNPLWRLLLFFMFSAATTSYIQALDKT